MPTVRQSDCVAAWPGVLNEDSRAIFRVASNASRAAETTCSLSARSPARTSGRRATHDSGSALVCGNRAPPDSGCGDGGTRCAVYLLCAGGVAANRIAYSKPVICHGWNFSGRVVPRYFDLRVGLGRAKKPEIRPGSTGISPSRPTQNVGTLWCRFEFCAILSR
jgi:hypothetical protein